MRNSGVWTQQAKLLASDGAANDEFGFAVDVEYDTVLVGAYFHNEKAGAAYVFTRDGEQWSQAAKLEAEDASAGDEFGRNVALSDGVAAIGAHFAEAVYILDVPRTAAGVVAGTK